ncbi:D-Ala-D-Ala carboxypeptidase family metallohydrolase [Thalassobaculum sp. OXR-137]|uniref:D-Ala-D-Ala carboxypeptidase family metallohydrolase n=1 Tax=Thalassobaculum sp. OXR-137 TaxID=3100173 RepID=UPI002AC95BC7|nr:D-Ala-D-Ala carboxypeptidase family metallohydrolase [Thalassobaculum sp. OXR-137]WPZ33959.1 D-Ala-D-Ala carboxypeptidase family metallohydrolase [Thalassobaculum sp. OXR-137]
MRFAWNLVCAAVLFGLIMAGSTPAVAEGRAVRLNGDAPPHRIWHRLVMPGHTVRLDVPKGYTASVDGEPVGRRWVAPEAPGHHSLRVVDKTGETVQQVALFVLVPSASIDDRGYLEGYRIGRYPRNTPKGFIRLGRNDLNIRISPSFRIGQFICKQQPGHFPKFLLVGGANVHRLEVLLAGLRKEGVTKAKNFFVMSGFRTPYYNAAIGSARLSRHMYGDASDIYVDVDPRDGVMDDLNGDGAVTKADADFLYDFAERLFAARPDVEPGGLGSYAANAVHGPFLHSDGRGSKARWGR